MGIDYDKIIDRDEKLSACVDDAAARIARSMAMSPRFIRMNVGVATIHAGTILTTHGLVRTQGADAAPGKKTDG